MTSTPKTVALTGATGFIGRHILDRLVESGCHVRALVRPGKDLGIHSPVVRQVYGSLEERQSLEELLGGVSSLVHCAGVVRGASLYDFTRVNAQGTRCLAQTFLEAGVGGRFVLISSLAAREPGLSHYASSKLQGETALKDVLPPEKWSIIRPPAVYGPGDTELMPLFRAMARGICPIMGSGDNRVSLVHVSDLAEAVIRVLESHQCCGRSYELHDGTPQGYSWSEVANIVSSITGRAVIRIKIPVPIVKIMGLVNITLFKIIGKSPMLTPGKVRELVHPDWTADNREICRDTAWRPRRTLREGLSGLI